jgi:hypothetical protein
VSGIPWRAPGIASSGNRAAQVRTREQRLPCPRLPRLAFSLRFYNPAKHEAAHEYSTSKRSTTSLDLACLDLAKRTSHPIRHRSGQPPTGTNPTHQPERTDLIEPQHARTMLRKLHQPIVRPIHPSSAEDRPGALQRSQAPTPPTHPTARIKTNHSMSATCCAPHQRDTGHAQNGQPHPSSAWDQPHPSSPSHASSPPRTVLQTQRQTRSTRTPSLRPHQPRPPAPTSVTLSPPNPGGFPNHIPTGSQPHLIRIYPMAGHAAPHIPLCKIQSNPSRPAA